MFDAKAEAKKIEGEIIGMRRAFHRCPELRMEMDETEKLILSYLSDIGITEVRSGIGGKGIAAVIRGRDSSRCLGIRADCDGLPIAEQTGLPFASENGNMHACGHDAHTAMALGAAKMLFRHRGELPFTVKFIFQPYEEGGGGAKAMIADGVLADPKVDAVVALHTGNLYSGDFKGGDICTNSRFMSFNITGFRVTFKGKGAHVSTPELAQDTVFAAASFIMQAQQIVSRNRRPASSAVCAVTVVHAGTRNNIIPGEAVLEGSLRSPDMAEENEFYARLGEIVRGVSVACGVEGTLEKTFFVPGTVIDSGLCEKFRRTVAETLGPEKDRRITELTPAGEDFAFFAQKCPAVYAFHCSKFADRENYPHHHPKFDIDEAQLWTGSAVLAAFAMKWADD